MRLYSLFFLLGTLFIQLFPSLPELPQILWTGLLLALIMAFIIRKSSHHNNYKVFSTGVLVAFYSGFLLAFFSAQKQLDSRLPITFEGRNILVQGTVVDIPEFREDGVRFRFNVISALTEEKKVPIPLSGVVRLGWYKNSLPISAGERWQLLVRLKQPSGFMNPGGFDYEKWLFTERVIATGYVRDTASSRGLEIQSKRLESASDWSVSFIRQKIHETIQQRVPDKASAAILSALSVADRSKLNKQQWEHLQKTGTSHLVAISGLHIAIVASFAFFPVFLLWRIFPSLNERIPVRVAGGVVAIIFATVYAMLAGFTLPTQRALLMVIIALLGLISRRNFPPSSIFATAMIAVLIFDPLAGMSVSFWLSFLAVGIILIISKRQMATDDAVVEVNNQATVKKSRRLKAFQLSKLQILLSLGMFPLGLLFFGTASVSSPIANLFAIPWVSLIVVPLTLLGVLFMPLSSMVSDSLFVVAALAVDWLFKGLDYLATNPLFLVNLPEIPVFYLLMVFGGFLFTLMPKGFPGRWLGLVALFPAIFFTPQKPELNSFSYTLLDAGQGMASVLRTKNHTLIYDAGKRVNDNFDIGKLVVVPYLQSKGVRHVDLMMISHEDLDHRGGAQAILESVEVGEVQSSDLSILPKYDVVACKAGDRWQWDGVNFEVLSPSGNGLENNGLSDETIAEPQISDNNLSCVLRVSTKSHSLLLTGDIEKQTEHKLVEKYADKLGSDVIIVPHHGSRTSSTDGFIEATNPKLALVPAGYRNRFGHPKEDVISRYKRKDITVMDTVEQGAIEIGFAEEKAEPIIKYWREKKRGFWSR